MIHHELQLIRSVRPEHLKKIRDNQEIIIDDTKLTPAERHLRNKELWEKTKSGGKLT